MNHGRFFLSILTTCVISVNAQTEISSPFNTLPSSGTPTTLNSPSHPFQSGATVPNSGTQNVCHNLDQIAKELEKQLVNNGSILNKIHDKTFLKRFYRQNGYLPIWLTESGFGAKAHALLKVIANDLTVTSKNKIHQDALTIEKYLNDKEYKEYLTVEVQLSQLYLDFLRHTLYGSINWNDFARKLKEERRKRISGNWLTVKPNYNLSELMLKPDINATVQEITPQHFSYQSLLKSLKKLKEFETKGGWDKLPDFKRLALGDQGDNVVKLRERLKQSGDLGKCEQSGEKLFESEALMDSSAITFQPEAIFDECLDTAVRHFQHRYGLEEDGIVGKGTRRVMNQSVEFLIQKVLLNLDRIKWLPRDLESRYLVVNIPEFMLHYIDDQQTKEQIRVIVGDRKHRTPIFSEKISFIVFNPYWKVPDGIVRREIIPAMMRNLNYLNKEGLEIHTTWSEDSPRINPSWLYWEDYYHGYEKFPYRIMQPPGPKNALGKIKFKFPNQFDVYLHDTPTKPLFQRTERAFSHGCIRVSQPYDLFKTIASFNSHIDVKKVDAILKGKRQRQINIQNQLPIHIVYLTAGYDLKKDEIQFRNDIYRYDELQGVDRY